MVINRHIRSFISPRILFTLAISLFMLIVGLFLSASPIHAQGNILPPSPVKCFNDSVSFLWQQDIDWTDLDSNGDVVGTYFDSGALTSLTVPGPYPAAFNGPIHIKIHEVGVYDAGLNRPTEGDQPNERVKIVLLKNGVAVWESAWSGDSATDDGLATGAISAEFAYGQLGNASLIDGFDEIRMVHPADATYGLGETAPNDYIPVGVCVEFEALGHIDGVVWCESDSSPNQSYEPLTGDAIIPNVSVSVLPDANCDGIADGSAIATVDTDSQGAYNFDSLPIGPAGAPICYVTQVDTADADLNSCNSSITSATIPVALDLNQPRVILRNFGFDEKSASLGDTVWSDTNSNGILDNGEAGVQGVQVNLWQDNGGDGSADIFLGSVTTDMDGNYNFIGLNPNTHYIVQFIAPSGTTFTSQNSGNGSNDSDAFPGNGYTAPVLLTDGENNPNIDAGLIPAGTGSTNATFGDTIYFDANNNGVQDSNEPGIPGVELNVLDASGTVVSTATTDANGVYFVTIPAGTYTVSVDSNTLPAGTSNTADPDGTLDGTYVITLNPNDNITNVDFGYKGSLALGNIVWEDTNANGVQDEPANAGIMDVVVNLVRDDNGDGIISATDTVIGTTTTGSDGSYNFECLLPGDYIVQIDPSNFALGSGVLAAYGEPTSNGGDPDNNNDTDSNGTTSAGLGVVSGPITLTNGDEPTNSGNTNDTVDFGFLSATGPTAVALSGVMTGSVSSTSTIIAALTVVLSLSTCGAIANKRNS